MFMVPPASGATSGPFGPQRLAAALAVPSPASTTSRSGDASTASRRAVIRPAGGVEATLAGTPNSASMASARAAA